jgi:hypothetical protein
LLDLMVQSTTYVDKYYIWFQVLHSN